MNYQIPLANLVERDHLMVKNKISTLNWIKKLDNNSCKTILEHLIFEPDSRLCARRLDELQETYELKTNNQILVSESTLRQSRDQVLMREGMFDDEIAQAGGQIDSVKKWTERCLKAFIIGGAAGLAYKALKIPASERKIVIDNCMRINPAIHKALVSNPHLAKILPKEPGFLFRSAGALWTSSKQGLHPSDIEYLGRIKNTGKMALALAAGVTSAVILINILYREVFSAEAKKCKGLIGKKRTECMCNAVIASAETAKKKAEEGLLRCDNAKDPQECRYKMKVEIRSWMKKIEEQKRKLARIGAVNNTVYPPARPDPRTTEEVKVGTPSDPFSMDSKPVSIPTNPFA